MKIVIPGGSGQVGQILSRHFHGSGHQVVVLARQPRAMPWRTVLWDGANEGPWLRELDRADVCINLSGRSVNCRYHNRNRRDIYNSRVFSTRLLNRVIAALPHPPALWLNASTATIYRHALDRPMDEANGELGGGERDAPDTWNFSIQVAKAWEDAFFSTPTPRTRKVALRSAMTFSPDRGGVFDTFLRLVRFGLGGAQGDGKQFVSWIHEVDFIRAIEFLIASEELTGVVNLASPNPLPNCDFMATLRAAWGTPIGLPAPKWLLEIGTFLLRTESELVLKSRRVIPTRLQMAGFDFVYPLWPHTAVNLVECWRACRRRHIPEARQISGALPGKSTT